MSMEVDMKEFSAALKEYAKVRKKDNAYIVIRVALNVAIKMLKLTPKATKANIRAIESRPWWPKYIAKQMTKPYKADAAREMSKAIIKARIGKVGFIVSGFAKIIKKLRAAKASAKYDALHGRGASQQSIGLPPRLERAPGDVEIPQPGLNATAVLKHFAAGTKDVVLPIFPQAMAAAAKDMRDFTRDQYKETARHFNAK